MSDITTLVDILEPVRGITAVIGGGGNRRCSHAAGAPSRSTGTAWRSPPRPICFP